MAVNPLAKGGTATIIPVQQRMVSGKLRPSMDMVDKTFDLSGEDPVISESAFVELNLRQEMPAEAPFPKVYGFEYKEETKKLSVRMERLYGSSLRAIMEKGDIPNNTCFTIMNQIVKALKPVHALGFNHNDLNPANIMLCPIFDPASDSSVLKVKLLDLGSARRIGMDHVKNDRVVGSLKFMSLEHLEGEALDHSSDFFQATVLFYRMLTGSDLFPSSLPRETKEDYFSRQIVCRSIAILPSLIQRSILYPPLLTFFLKRLDPTPSNREVYTAEEYQEALVTANENIPLETTIKGIKLSQK